MQLRRPNGNYYNHCNRYSRSSWPLSLLAVTLLLWGFPIFFSCHSASSFVVQIRISHLSFLGCYHKNTQKASPSFCVPPSAEANTILADASAENAHSPFHTNMSHHFAFRPARTASKNNSDETELSQSFDDNIDDSKIFRPVSLGDLSSGPLLDGTSMKNPVLIVHDQSEFLATMKQEKQEQQQPPNGRTITPINSLVFSISEVAPSSSSQKNGALGLSTRDDRIMDDSTTSYILAILKSTDRVDVALLKDVVLQALQNQKGGGRKEGVTDPKDFVSVERSRVIDRLIASSMSWALSLAPQDRVESLCGFAPGCVPPVGLIPAPLLTVVESSLYNNDDAKRIDDDDDDDTRESERSIALDDEKIPPSLPIFKTDQSNVKTSLIDAQRRPEQLLQGGGGSPHHSSLLTLETLLKDGTCLSLGAFRETRINDGGVPNSIPSTAGRRQNEYPKPSQPRTIPLNSYSQVRKAASLATPKPYFGVAPPPDDLVHAVLSPQLPDKNGNTASTIDSSSSVTRPSNVTTGSNQCETMVAIKEQQTLLQPVATSFVARISGVRRIARRLVFCDAAPPNGVRAVDYMGTERSTGGDNHPWKSPRTHTDMAVQLIFGKTFCDQWGPGNGKDNYGDTECEKALRSLKVGQLILVQGATNVCRPESLQNWATKQSLDIVVSSLTVLREETVGIQQPWSCFAPFDAETSSSLVPSANRSPRREIRKRISANSSVKETPYLQISDLYPSAVDEKSRNGLPITLVDSLESVLSFGKELSALLASPKLSPPSSHYDLVGIDCEWKPSFLASNRYEPKPVLLMQICIHSLQHAYLLDLQSLIRPLLDPSTAPNEIERAVCQVLSDLLVSERLIKVGYQLAQDLRRLAASYPHVKAFQSVNVVLEASALGKKTMYLTRHVENENARLVLASLNRMTECFLGCSLDKEEQCSDWSRRPLQQKQLVYGALDAMVTPVMVEQFLSMADASIFYPGPSVGRFVGDSEFRRSIMSFRYLFLADLGVSASDAKTMRALQAKKVIGNQYVVTQQWIAGTSPPTLPSIPEDTDANEVIRVPCNTICVQVSSNTISSEVLDATYSVGRNLVGKRCGSSKAMCLRTLLREYGKISPATDSILDEDRLDFPQRCGYVEFQDAVALFVNLPSTAANGKQARKYPNEWLEDGQILTWFLSENEWKQRTTPLAQKLLSTSTAVVEVTDDAPVKAPPSSLVFLFVRIGKGSFLCCGQCSVVAVGERELNNEVNAPENLVKLHLVLSDWVRLQECEDFRNLINPWRRKDSEGDEDFRQLCE